MTNDTGNRGDRGEQAGPGLLAAIGIGAAMLLCCAGPVLIAAGALGAPGHSTAQRLADHPRRRPARRRGRVDRTATLSWHHRRHNPRRR